MRSQRIKNQNPYHNKLGMFSDHGTPAKIMLFLMQNHDIVFSPSTLSKSMGMKRDTIRINIRYLLKFGCLKIHNSEGTENKTVFFSVTNKEHGNFINLVEKTRWQT